MKTNTQVNIHDYEKMRETLEKNILGENGSDWCVELQNFLNKKPTWLNKPDNIIKLPPGPFYPGTESFLGSQWSVDEFEKKKYTDLTFINLALVNTRHMLDNSESVVGGEERLRRVKFEEGHLALGAKVFFFLKRYPQFIPEEWKKTDCAGYKIFYHFDGTVFRSPHGLRGVLFLSWSGDGWYWSMDWLSHDFSRRDLSVLLPVSSIISKV